MPPSALHQSGLQKEFDCLADVDKCLLNRLALRLAPLQFWAPRVAALLVLFYYDANLARHQPFILAPPAPGIFGRITGWPLDSPIACLTTRLRFNSEPVVDGTPKLLLAFEAAHFADRGPAPEPVLIKHCKECIFEACCRKRVTDKDDPPYGSFGTHSP